MHDLCLDAKSRHSETIRMVAGCGSATTTVPSPAAITTVTSTPRVLVRCQLCRWSATFENKKGSSEWVPKRATQWQLGEDQERLRGKD